MIYFLNFLIITGILWALPGTMVNYCKQNGLLVRDEYGELLTDGNGVCQSIFDLLVFQSKYANFLDLYISAILVSGMYFGLILNWINYSKYSYKYGLFSKIILFIGTFFCIYFVLALISSS